MESVYKQIKQGHQCYVICPLIEDSDAETLAGVESVETTAQNLKAWFAKYPGVRIEAISGDMKAKDVQAGIDKFAAGSADILISTTIVEVGVNVPNSTVIVIKNAERFGLAQLHQLRGRSAQQLSKLLRTPVSGQGKRTPSNDGSDNGRFQDCRERP